MATPADSVILEEEIDENYEPTQDGAQNRSEPPLLNPRSRPPAAATSAVPSLPPREKMPRHPPSRPRLTPPAPPSTALSRAEMIDYAKWLGMDLETEKDLMWIAREGLKAPLPEHWKPCKAPDTGDIYYFNFQTGESVWKLK